MRTKEEIINHVHYVGYGKKAMKEICAFMVGAGLKEKAEVIQFKIGEGSFNDFYEWFLLDSERKIIVETLNKVNDIFKSAIEIETQSWSELFDKLINAFDKPQFKVGDWIRDKATNFVMKIGNIDKGIYISTSLSNHISFENAIKYEPKDGEFYTQEEDKTTKDALCFCCTPYYYNFNCKSLWSNISVKDIFKEHKYRPSTEEEIKFLKDKVKKTYNKEWNGKEWVDIKPAFKKGDYISVKGLRTNSDHLIIVENVDNNIISALAYYCQYQGFNEVEYNAPNCASLATYIIHFSTPEEIKEMDEALARDGKYFDKETLEIKDILKEGDIVIVWDNNNKRAIICVYTLSLKNAWKNMIKFESIEQYKKILKGEN
jgi:hypothetical protein